MTEKWVTEESKWSDWNATDRSVVACKRTKSLIQNMDILENKLKDGQKVILSAPRLIEILQEIIKNTDGFHPVEFIVKTDYPVKIRGKDIEFILAPMDRDGVEGISL